MRPRGNCGITMESGRWERLATFDIGGSFAYCERCTEMDRTQPIQYVHIMEHLDRGEISAVGRRCSARLVNKAVDTDPPRRFCYMVYQRLNKEWGFSIVDTYIGTFHHYPSEYNSKEIARDCAKNEVLRWRKATGDV